MTLLCEEFNAIVNTEKVKWYLKTFLNVRDKIQRKYFRYINENKTNILFFDQFEIYAFTKNMYYPFKTIKMINLINRKKKSPIWETPGSIIEAINPSLRPITFPYSKQS